MRLTVKNELKLLRRDRDKAKKAQRESDSVLSEYDAQISGLLNSLTNLTMEKGSIGAQDLQRTFNRHADPSVSTTRLANVLQKGSNKAKAVADTGLTPKAQAQQKFDQSIQRVRRGGGGPDAVKEMMSALREWSQTPGTGGRHSRVMGRLRWACAVAGHLCRAGTGGRPPEDLAIVRNLVKVHDKRHDEFLRAQREAKEVDKSKWQPIINKSGTYLTKLKLNLVYQERRYEEWLRQFPGGNPPAPDADAEAKDMEVEDPNDLLNTESPSEYLTRVSQIMKTLKDDQGPPDKMNYEVERDDNDDALVMVEDWPTLHEKARTNLIDIATAQRNLRRQIEELQANRQKAKNVLRQNLEVKLREIDEKNMSVDDRSDAIEKAYKDNENAEAEVEQLLQKKQARIDREQIAMTRVNSEHYRDFGELLKRAQERADGAAADVLKQAELDAKEIQRLETKLNKSVIDAAKTRLDNLRSKQKTKEEEVKEEARRAEAEAKREEYLAQITARAQDAERRITEAANARITKFNERVQNARLKAEEKRAKDESRRVDNVAKITGELLAEKQKVLALTAQKNELEQEVQEWRNMAGSGDRKGAPNPAALTVFPLVTALFTRLTLIKAEGVVGALQSVEDFMRGFNLRNANIFRLENGQDSLQTAKETWDLDELMAPRDERVHPGAHALLQLVRRGIVALSLQRTDDRAHRIGQRKAMLVLVKTMETSLGWFNDNTRRQAANYTPWKALSGRDRVLRPEFDRDADDDPEDDEPDPGDEDDDDYGFFNFGDGNDEEDKRAEREFRSDGSRAARSAKLWMVRPHAYHELFRGSQKSVMRKLFNAHKLKGTLSVEHLSGKPLSYLTSLEMQLHDAMHEAMQTMVVNVWGTQSDAADRYSAFSMMSANIINRSDDVELPRLLRDLKSIKIQRVNENSATFFPALFEDVVVLPVKGIKDANDKSTGWEKRLDEDLAAINRLELRSSATITVVLCADQDAADVMKAAKEVRTKLTGFRLFPLVIHPQEAKYRSLLRLFVSLYRLLGYVTFYSNRQLHPDWESTGNLWSGSSRTEGLQAYLHPDVGDVYAPGSKGIDRVISNLIRSYTALWEKVQNWSDQSDLATFRQVNNPGLRPEQVEFQLSGNPRAVAWNNLFTEAYLQGHTVSRRKANA